MFYFTLFQSFFFYCFVTENFSWAAAKFVFKRQTNFFILQVYLPCIMIVMVSWSSFWICRDAVPARAAISVTTILTIITMLGVVNSNMPKVSYVKALDFYLFISFVFVFLSLGEYIIVLNADRFPLPPYFRKRSVKENKGLKVSESNFSIYAINRHRWQVADLPSYVAKRIGCAHKK